MPGQSKRRIAISIAALAVVLGASWHLLPARTAQLDNTAVLKSLAHWDEDRIVDLTHAFYPGIPHSEALGDETIEPLFSHDPGIGRLGDGYQLDRYTFPGQWGTHVDAPVHFHEGMRSIDQIGPQQMILPLVVLDVHEEVERDPDYVVSMDDVRRWESRHGKIPVGAFVALRTDWSKRWSDASAFFNADANGFHHSPGWGEAVLHYVDIDRQARGIGHETADTDPGVVSSKFEFPLESWHLKQDRFQIEMLTNLDKVPEAGAVIIATWPKARGGSGFPARVLALLP
jgi:kynurenine formamidase